jgi:hypothetical protein
MLSLYVLCYENKSPQRWWDVTNAVWWHEYIPTALLWQCLGTAATKQLQGSLMHHCSCKGHGRTAAAARVTDALLLLTPAGKKHCIC